MIDHLGPVRRLLKKAPISQAPDPWRLVSRIGIGGLTSVGFEPATENLLVISGSGQSLIDCSTGQRLYRNREHDGYGPGLLEARRLDVSEADPIRMAGLEGGGMPTLTSDGWTVQSIPLNWPETFHILQPPQASIFFNAGHFAPHNKDGTFYLLEKGAEETRAFGFSWTGQSLIWACSSDLMIWSRSP